MKKTILFDFDGTIVDSKKLVVEIYNDIAEKHSYKKISNSEILYLRDIPIKDRCKQFGIPMHMLPILLCEAKKKYKDYVPSLNIISGVSDVLNKLKDDGFNLAILSSNSISAIKLFLDKNKISVFDSVFSSKNLFGKHITIRSFLKNFDVCEKDVLYVGDEVRDVISCKKCNVRIAAVTWGYDSTNLLLKESPDFMVNEPREILRIAKNV